MTDPNAGLPTDVASAADIHKAKLANAKLNASPAADEGVWSMEARYQSLMSGYCKDLPKRFEQTVAYNKERAEYVHIHKEETFMDRRPYTSGGRLGMLGRGKKDQLTGDFASVSQHVWDEIRFVNLESERPQGPAYSRAVKNMGAGLDEESRLQIEKMEKLQALSGEQKGGGDATSALLASYESDKKTVKRVPKIHTPYKAGKSIPWPDVAPVKRSNGPAFQRNVDINNIKANAILKVYDPFTGTYILPVTNRKEPKEIKLNYELAKNAYVRGDALAGLRNQKRHKRIVAASDFLKETKMTPEAREERRKKEAKERSDLELETARARVRERKMFQAEMRTKLMNMDVQAGRGGPKMGRKKPRPRTAPDDMSVASSVYSMESLSSTAPPPDILVIRHDDEPDEAPVAMSDAELLALEGTRVKTPLWGSWGERKSSAGSTPFNRESFSQGKFSGWLGGLVRSLSRGDSRGDPQKEEDLPELSISLSAPPMGLDGTTPQSSPSKSTRPSGSRKKHRNDHLEESSLDGSLGMGSVGSAGSAGSFEFLEDVTLDDSPSKSGSSSPSKKKKKKKKGGGESNMPDDEISIITLDTRLESPSRASSPSKKKKTKRTKTKQRRGDDASSKYNDDESTIATKHSAHDDYLDPAQVQAQNLSAYVNSLDAQVATFEFIDDMSLASSMGTIKSKKNKSPRKKSSRKRGKSEDTHASDEQSSMGSVSIPWIGEEEEEGAARSGENEGESEFVTMRDHRKAALAAHTPRLEALREDGVLDPDETFKAIATEMVEEEKERRLKNEEPVMTKEEEKTMFDNEMKALKPVVETAQSKAVTGTLDAAVESFGMARRMRNRVYKNGARMESYMIKKKVWPKKWRISGRGNHNKSAGFLLAKDDPLMQGQNVGTRVLYSLYLGGNALLNKTAYTSYMLVYMLGGAEAASTMSLRDFLVKRSMTSDEMIVAAADAERALVVRSLTQMKAPVKVDSRDHTGMTALMCALDASCRELDDGELRDWSRSQRRQRTVRFLRGRGSTPEDSETIKRMRAVKYERVLEVLIAKGADINAKCFGTVDEDVTCVHIAASNGNVHRLKWLLAKGAAINCETESRMTPLHLAAKLGKCDAVTYLLKQDANMIARNSIGWTPLHFAARTGGTQMVKLLLTAGADKYIEDDEGRTPTMVAQEFGKLSSFEALRKWTNGVFEAKEALDYLHTKM